MQTQMDTHESEIRCVRNWYAHLSVWVRYLNYVKIRESVFGEEVVSRLHPALWRLRTTHNSVFNFSLLGDGQLRMPPKCISRRSLDIAKRRLSQKHAATSPFSTTCRPQEQTGSSQNGRTTHFGFETVPESAKQAKGTIFPSLTYRFSNHRR